MAALAFVFFVPDLRKIGYDANILSSVRTFQLFLSLHSSMMILVAISVTIHHPNRDVDTTGQYDHPILPAFHLGKHTLSLTMSGHNTDSVSSSLSPRLSMQI